MPNTQFVQATLDQTEMPNANLQKCFINPNPTFNRHPAGTPLSTTENNIATAGGKNHRKSNSNGILTLSVATTGTRLPTIENIVHPRNGKLISKYNTNLFQTNQISIIPSDRQFNG